jgi:ParB family chromosome partitioning protein
VSKKALGKGLDALLSPEPQKVDGDRETARRGKESGVIFIPISDVVPNPDQPRKAFREESLDELAESIREKGIIQPIIAEKADEGMYRIIAGERRYRAAKKAQLEHIPVIIRSFTKEEKLEIALIENVQRDDLTPIEEAQAYHHLMQVTGINQEEVAQRVGKKRSTIANSLRLLKMPDDMRTALSEGKITSGHARAILSVVNPAAQKLLFERIVDKNLSVREAERQAGMLNEGKRNEKEDGPARSPGKKSPELIAIEQQLVEHLGTKVVVRGSNNRGKVEIEYYSSDDLERLYELLANTKLEL